MIELNGKNYKICLIDTNVISEMIIRPDPFLKNYLNTMRYQEYIPGFSIFTILELRKIDRIYNIFLDLFSVFPCFILKNLDLLYDNEVKEYPESSKVSPILFSAPGLLANKEFYLRNVLERLFQEAGILKFEEKWNSGKLDILQGILDLKKNFLPKNNTYTKKEIYAFVQIAVFQQIAIRSFDFAQNNIPVSIDAFPSLKMIVFMVFYKFYVDQRRPIESDTFDIIISSVIPYVDAIITEKHMAQIITSVKKQDNFIQQLEVFTLKNFSDSSS